MIVIVRCEVEAPDGATHYSGQLLDEPTWWKYSVNSTGVIRNWCYFREGTWYVHTEWKPHWIKEIPK